MTVTRRKFLQGGACAGAISILQPGLSRAAHPTREALEKVAEKPVLQLGELKESVIIDKIELLRKWREHFLRVRSRDGAWGLSVDNGRIDILLPILQKLVIP